MQNGKSWIVRNIVPHVVALAIFALLSALFFAPQYEGKALRQFDMVQFSGITSDIHQHIDRYGEHPEWAGRNFSGMPSYLIDMDYDGRWVKNVADHTYILGQPAAWIFIAMAGFYLMLLLFGVNPWLSIVGGVAYGLSSYFVIIIGAGHITKMMALAWIPPMMGAVWYAYRRHMWLGAALTGIFASVEISTSHPQIPYYFLFAILALVINELVIAYKEKTLVRFGKATALLALAAALAVGSNIVQLYYVSDYSKDSTRGKSELTAATVDTDNHTGGLDRDYITMWSYGKLETLNLLVPNLYGGGHDFAPDGEVAQSLRKYQVPRDFVSNVPSYWGTQPSTEGPVYLGAGIVFLCVFGLFLLNGRQKWWLLSVSVLAIFLAWGRHMMWFTDLFLDYFPMYNKFRTVSMILVVVEWSVPLLAMLGLWRLWQGGVSDEKFKKGFKWSLGMVGGLTLVIAILGPAFSSFSGANDQAMGLPEDVIAAMQGERASMMRADAFRSLGFVLAAAALVWLFYKGKLKRGWFVAALLVMVVLDLFPLDKRYVSAADFRPKREALAIPMTEADKLILQDTTDYRVANLTTSLFQDATTSYYHRSVGGYHAAKLRRYQDLIEHHLSQNNMAAYDMLNTKYFIIPDQQNGGSPIVQANPQACGSAWFVDSIAWVDNADGEIAALNGKAGFDPHTTAIVDRRFASQINGIDLKADTTATIQLTEYRVNRQTYRTRAVADGVAVLSEIYYPKGWSATMDGEPVEYFRADYVLRAIRVPAGEHTIVFSFKAPHHALLVGITRASSLILLLGSLGLMIGLGMRNRKKEDSDGR